jgi:3-phosphoshikimate 1-carboxyvinyltransferase
VKVGGSVRPPGDKSISHRAVMLAGLARGTSKLTGLLTGEDVKSTARVLRQLGAEISSIREGATVAVTASRFSPPSSRLDCGNSGTTARLMLGILAGQRFAATLTGDASLRRRPMRRVTEPLRAMGAEITEEGRGDSLPITIRGGRLRPLAYTTPVASAQIKSALLFAALTGSVAVTIREPYRSRDHTERLFAHLGLGIHERDGAIVYEPTVALSDCPAVRLSVPGDASSAAFLVAAAVLAEAGELLVENVGVNPTRTGFLVVLERMGAHVERVNLRDEGGEPVADLVARPAALSGTEVTAAEVPTLVDEVPVLAVLASRAAGETVFREVGELRVKESNRLELLATNLRAVGVEAEAHGNDLHVCGTARPPRGRVVTARDHRLAMAFAVLGTLPGADVKLSERASVAISYPRFFADVRRIRATGIVQRGT